MFYSSFKSPNHNGELASLIPAIPTRRGFAILDALKTAQIYMKQFIDYAASLEYIVKYIYTYR